MTPRYVVRAVEGYLSLAPGSGQSGVSYMVVDTRWNYKVVATYRSEDYTAHGRMWARIGAENECRELNAVQDRHEATQAASGTAA